MPKKPTTPFGYVTFSKDRKVSKHQEVLSSDKAQQEKDVAKHFVEAFNVEYPDAPISDYRELPENDHDFVLIRGTKETLLQVTELVERSFTIRMTKEEYDSGKFEELAPVRDPSNMFWRIDKEKRDTALWDLISRKIGKNYAKGSQTTLWLLIFATNPLYLTEYCSGGSRCISQALAHARSSLGNHLNPIFDEIWYTNMVTGPVRIWPAI